MDFLLSTAGSHSKFLSKIVRLAEVCFIEQHGSIMRLSWTRVGRYTKVQGLVSRAGARPRFRSRSHLALLSLVSTLGDEDGEAIVRVQGGADGAEKTTCTESLV